MCHCECAVKLNSLINSIDNKTLRRECEDIGEYVIKILDKRITDLPESLEKSNKHSYHSTNYYLLQKHFLLKAVEDVNNELTRNNAGFIIDVSDVF